MARPLVVKEFPGMDNATRQGLLGRTTDGAPLPAAIKAVLNMVVTPDLKLEKRAGYQLWKALPGAHSIWFDGNAFFCAAKGSASPESLYRVTVDKVVTEVCPIIGLGEPLFFVSLNGNTYISSRTWNGIYRDGLVSSWGSYYGDDPAMLDGSLNSEERLLLNTMPAPFMENLCHAGGRIFGSVGPRLYYNDPPMAYDMFRPDAFYDFPGPLTMVAADTDGLYLATEDKTWFVAGYDPTEWEPKLVGDGAIPGSVQTTAQSNSVSDSVSVKQYNVMWLNRKGVQVGVNGLVKQLTQDRVKFDFAGRAASVFRLEGGGQYLSSFAQPSDVGFGDTVTCEVVRKGTLLV